MLDILTVVPVAKANALQRAGRAGRQAKGKCFRLFLKNNYDDLPDQMLPVNLFIIVGNLKKRTKRSDSTIKSDWDIKDSIP